jgi:hypothetical protein
MRIKQLDYRRLRNEEWFSLFLAIKVLVLKYGVQQLGITDLWGILEPLLHKVDNLLEVWRKSKYTQEIEKINKEIKALFRGIFEYVKALRSVPDENIHSDNEDMYLLLSRYKENVLNGSYAEETGSVYNLLQDLKGSTFSASVTSLGLQKITGFLDDAEQRFRECSNNRREETVAKPKGNLKETRTEADEIFKSITDKIYAQLLVDKLGGDVMVDPNDLKTGIYDDSLPEYLMGNVNYNFAWELNEILQKYHTLLAVRESRRKKKDDTEPEEEEEINEEVE